MNNIISKYDSNINDAVQRISNSCKIITQTVGLAGGTASANLYPGKDTDVIYQNCLIEIAKLIDEDNSIISKQEAFNIVAEEISNRLKKYNQSKMEKTLSRNQTADSLGSIIEIGIIASIILFIAWLIGLVH